IFADMRVGGGDNIGINTLLCHQATYGCQFFYMGHTLFFLDVAQVRKCWINGPTNVSCRRLYINKSVRQQPAAMALKQGTGTQHFAIRHIALRKFLTILLWAAALPLMAQISLRGRVVDANTGEGIYGVSVRLADTAIGTSTDHQGFYKLSTPKAGSPITFHALGYKSLTVPFPAHGQPLHVALDEDTQTLDEVVIEAKGRYRNRDNPAVALIRQVIRHKPVNRLSRYDYVSVQAYEKVMMALRNPPRALLNSAFTRRYRFALENIDT